jgi:hypothetical protein
MAGLPGGQNRKTAEAHILAGTYRADRHARPGPEPPDPVSAGDRRRTLQGLSPAARRLAGRLLDDYAGWDAASLTSLRLDAESAVRLATITDDGDRRREARMMLALLKRLELER